METELLCLPCSESRKQGLPVDVANICEECFELATTEFCDFVGTGGKPQILTRSESFNDTLKETYLPAELGTIVDIAPVNHSLQSIWLLLGEDGRVFRLDADSGEFTHVAHSSVPAEPEHKPFAGRSLTKRLHASNSGEFIAVVNDYGRYGQIIDLRSGKVTASLDGGEYHPETVPLSFAFADVGTSMIAIHRTSWNRLDFSDPATGKILSSRGPTSYQRGESQPEHYLDYFHGALYVDPTSTHILDDGWIWHPVGVPTVWSLERWFSENVWESEDGSTKKNVCGRDAYWDQAITWLDANRIVIGGLGEGFIEIIDGARIFDVTASGEAGPEWRSDWPWARELNAFAGPAGEFFSDGLSLFSSSESGLSRWSIEDGVRTGCLQGFQPSHHHRGAGELIQLKGRVLVRWNFA